MPRQSPIPLDQRDRAPLLASMAGAPPGALSRPSPYTNALTDPAPPPIGSGATAGNPLLGTMPNALATAQTPQPVPAAAMPSQPPTALPPGPPPPPAALADGPTAAPWLDALRSSNMPPDQVDQHAERNDGLVHVLGTLAAKGDDLTHKDVTGAAMAGVKSGQFTPEEASQFVSSLSGDPKQMRAEVKGALTNAVLSSVSLAALKMERTPPAAAASTPQPMPAGAQGTA